MQPAQKRFRIYILHLQIFKVKSNTAKIIISILAYVTVYFLPKSSANAHIRIDNCKEKVEKHQNTKMFCITLLGDEE